MEAAIDWRGISANATTQLSSGTSMEAAIDVRRQSTPGERRIITQYLKETAPLTPASPSGCSHWGLHKKKAELKFAQLASRQDRSYRSPRDSDRKPF
jgi:hypothetical protein